MKKTMLALLILILVLMCATAMAADERKSGLFTYTLKGNGTATITGFDWEHNDGDVYIPSMIDGYTVTGVDKEAFMCEQYFENSVIVRLPNGIVTIGEKAFYGAPISTINIPTTTEYIGSGAFAFCPLMQISIDGKNNNFAVVDGALYNKMRKELIAYPIASRPKVPDGIVSIGDYAMAGLGATLGFDIRTVLPDTITTIGKYAFTYSSISTPKGSDMLFSENLTSIDDGAFFHAEFFSSDYLYRNVSFPASLKSIGNNSFSGASVYQESTLHFYSTELTIGDYAFSEYGGNDLNYIRFNGSVVAVGEYAFKDIKATRIGMIDISKANHIGRAALSDALLCPTTIIWPEEVSIIPEHAFYKTTADWNELNIVVPEGVEIISEEAFLDCHPLLSITLPNSLTTIAARAFSGCNMLESVNIPSSVTAIGDNAFERASIILTVEKDSYAALWAKENGYSYKYSEGDDLDWLNN